MNSKVLNFLFLFLLSISISHAAYEVNSSWTDLEVENDGWCANLAIPFTVYNKTEYDIKEQIEDNLCKGNETPDDDDCEEFEEISGTVKIYDGPFDNEEALVLDTSLSDNSFTHTFTKEGTFLIEVRPSGLFNDWYVSDFFVDDCNIGNSNEEETNETEEIEEEVSLLKDQSFYYEDTKTTLDLTSSGLNSSVDLNVKTYLNPSTIGLTGLNGALKVVQIIGEDNFSELTITSTLDNIIDSNSIFKVYKYDTPSASWNEVPTGSVTGTNMVITAAEIGIYAVTEEQQEIIEEIVVAPEPVIEDTSPVVEQTTLPQSPTSSGPNMMIIYGLVTLLVIILGTVMYSKHKPKKKEEVEHVVSYADILAKTQEYVTKHKNTYSQDQIYRALKDAKVPKDIIDKVFILEY